MILKKKITRRNEYRCVYLYVRIHIYIYICNANVYIITITMTIILIIERCVYLKSYFKMINLYLKIE